MFALLSTICVFITVRLLSNLSVILAGFARQCFPQFFGFFHSLFPGMLWGVVQRGAHKCLNDVQSPVPAPFVCDFLKQQFSKVVV